MGVTLVQVHRSVPGRRHFADHSGICVIDWLGIIVGDSRRRNMALGQVRERLRLGRVDALARGMDGGNGIHLLYRLVLLIE